jgi:hypothetical protein
LQHNGEEDLERNLGKNLERGIQYDLTGYGTVWNETKIKVNQTRKSEEPHAKTLHY